MPLDGIALQTLKTAVVDEDLDLVTCEGCPNLVPVNLQPRLLGLALAGYLVYIELSL